MTLSRMRHPLTTVLFLITITLQAQVPPYVTEDFPTDEQGYYFINASASNGMMMPSNVLVLDGAGHVAFRRTMPGSMNFRAWPDGRMSCTSMGRNIILDSTFAIVDTVICVNGVTTDPHDIRLLPNGHFLLLGTEERIMDLSAYPYFQSNNAPGSATALVECGVVQELDAAKQLVWEWHVVDHFDFLETDTTLLSNPLQVDWSHCNAVEQDTDGNILLSCRHFNEIVKIDRNADTVIWHLGGVSNDFTFTNDAGFIGQHDIRRLPNGHLTLFDNGRAPAHPCRGVEYALDLSGMTCTVVWARAFNGTATSRSMGSVQRLSNGNTLIGWGNLQPDNAMFSVYRPDSSRLCELAFVDTLITYRALYFDDLPFMLHRPGISCSVQDTTYTLTADAGWSSYVWSTGATGPGITAGANDTMFVEVPVSSGGWLRSAPFVPADHCAVLGMVPASQEAFRMFPNPAGPFVDLAFGTAGPRQIELTDAFGRVIWNTTTIGTDLRMPLERFPPGIYLVRVDGSVHRLVKGR